MTPHGHPAWAAPGMTAIVRRDSCRGRTIHEHVSRVARHTPTLIVLETGERFRRSPWGDRYNLTPRYLDYTTYLVNPAAVR